MAKFQISGDLPISLDYTFSASLVWVICYQIALPDPVKVSSDPSPVVVVVSLLFIGSVLTARRDTI